MYKNVFVKGHYRNGKYIGSHYRDYIKNNNPNIINTYVNTQFLEIEYKYLKSITRSITPFKKDIKFQEIDCEIKDIVKKHLEHLISVKKSNKIHSEYIQYLGDYIEDNLEATFIKLDNITVHYKSFEEIIAVVYMLILEKYEPDRFKIEYINKNESTTVSKEEAIGLMNKIIDENFQQLIYDFKKSDWDYRRQRFFENVVKQKLYNPKIAFHILFKEICNEKLVN